MFKDTVIKKTQVANINLERVCFKVLCKAHKAKISVLKKYFFTGPTRAVKAGQKSLVLALWAPNEPTPVEVLREPPTFTLFQIQYESPLSLALCSEPIKVPAHPWKTIYKGRGPQADKHLPQIPLEGYSLVVTRRDLCIVFYKSFFFYATGCLLQVESVLL